jgi:hypothetical protein
LKYDPLEIAVLRWLKAHSTEEVQGWDDVWGQISEASSCTQAELRHCLKMLSIEGLVTYNYIPSIPRVECSITKEGLLAIRTF